MNYRMKYVIIDFGLNVLPYVFSEMNDHASFAYAVQGGKPTVLGAGFCYIDVENEGSEIVGDVYKPQFVCYGKSVSLDVESRGDEDSKFLNKYFGLTSEY